MGFLRFHLEAFTPLLVDTVAPLSLLEGAIAVLLLLLLLRDLLARRKKPSRLLRWIANQSLILLFIVSASATLGSLFFSEIALWVPCKLCWWQRIFIYPQPLLLALALARSDRGVLPYILLLSTIGLAFSLYHYTEQMLALINPLAFDPSVPCDLSGISCRATEILVYGFVTIPFLSSSVLLLHIALSLVALRHYRELRIKN